jgi:predicted SnoaL-like aldol condensation-catalyzing enzyme
LIGRNVDASPKFLKADYVQHNPQVPTGLKGFMDTFRDRFSQKLPADYKRKLLNVIGDNDMVVVYVRQTWTGKWPTSSSTRIRHVPRPGRHDC